MIKKLLLTIGLLVTLVASSKAGSNSVFNAKEFSVHVGSGYVFDPDVGFQNDYSLNFSAGVGYAPSRYVTLNANVPFYQSKGVSVREVDAGLALRLPIGHVAPYVGVSAVYDWEAENNWAYIAKGGLEIRLNPKWGVFGEYQFRNDDLQFEEGSHGLFGGVKLVF